jgi:hypothetical protein
VILIAVTDELFSGLGDTSNFPGWPVEFASFLRHKGIAVIALVLILTFVVLLLAILVAGLLRSHADILKALHDLGGGVGDPATTGGSAHHHGPGAAAPNAVPVPFTLGPPLPAERDAVSAPTIAGVTPTGDALAVAVTGHDTLTLVAFLSSGCATCAGFWEAFRRPGELGLPDGMRLVVVTKGPEMEIAAEVQMKAHPRLSVIMSTEAWGDYEVPGSPFFVLVDGKAGRRIGEGVAHHFSQVVELVRRAEVDLRSFGPGSRSRATADGLDGPARESANDEELRAAGIHPGHQSLYPGSLADVFPSSTVPTGAEEDGNEVRERADADPVGHRG